VILVVVVVIEVVIMMLVVMLVGEWFGGTVSVPVVTIMY
jgi:hypothetical protein